LLNVLRNYFKILSIAKTLFVCDTYLYLFYISSSEFSKASLIVSCAFSTTTSLAFSSTASFAFSLATSLATSLTAF